MTKLGLLQNPKRSRALLALFIILLLGTGLRFYHIDSHSLWNDESLSLRETQGLVWGYIPDNVIFTGKEVQKKNTFYNVIWSNIRGDSGNGIAYILTLRCWIELFGTSDLAVRSLSAIFGLITIVVGYFFACLVFLNRKVALTASLFLAIHPMLIDLSQEARSYMMATCFCLLATTLLVKIVQNKRSNLFLVVFYGISSGFAILSHYLCVYIFLAHLLYVIVSGHSKKNWSALILGGSLGAFIVLCWMFNGGIEGLEYIHTQNNSYQNQSISNINSLIKPLSLVSGITGNIQILLSISGNYLQNAGIQIRYLVVWLPFLFVAVLYFLKNREIAFNNRVLILSAFFLAPIFATKLAIKAGHTISFYLNYSTFSAPFSAFLLAIFIQNQNRYLKVLPVFFGLLMIISIGTVYWGTGSHKITSNEQIQLSTKIDSVLNSQKDTSQLVIYSDRIDAELINIYLDGNHSLVKQIIQPESPNRIVIVTSSLDTTPIYLN